MESLNYHHLHYFVEVARTGSVAAASRNLGVGRPAISAQVKSLERSLGTPLLRRVGRSLELTPAGERALRHAEEIFARGRELVQDVRGAESGAGPFRVGVADVLPKLVAYRLLGPALGPERVSRLVCLEDEPALLFAELALRKLDLVLSDAPLPPGLGLRGRSHFLGASPILLMGEPALAARYRDGFPGSLDDAPLLLPRSGTALRRAVDHWLALRGLRPGVRAEFDDSALMKAFGQGGWGLFPAPALVEQAIRQDYGVELVGSLSGVDEEVHAVTPDPEHCHPLVEPFLLSARRTLEESAP